ncbi:MAG: tetratricopeptide repeat protein, partial [Elusimicrobia bacterium]|nr:tetratricopeptide repeat protein [Elusimicrobiota bacterium]
KKEESAEGVKREDPPPQAAAPELEAKPGPAPEPKAEAKPEPKAEVKPEPKAESAPAAAPAAKGPGAAEEFAFAKDAAEDGDGKVSEAAMEELALFARRHPASDHAPEALLLLAGLRQKHGDWQIATAALLRLLYEYPDTKIGLRAKSDYLTIVDKKASRRHRPILSELVTPPGTAGKADRLSALWRKLAERAPDALYEPVAAEIRDFTVRFPGHPDGDKLQAALARLHAANDKPAAALLSWRKLLALFPESPSRPRARMAIGDLYAGALRDPKKAIDAYQELVEKHPDAPEVQAALENSARLFEDKLRQYALAVEMHERIVKLFPKTPASLKSLKAIAKLQHDRLDAADDAVKTLMRLSSMHGGQDGIDALLQAANYARRDLKDFSRQAEMLRKVSDDYAGAKEAPQALYDAAGVYENSVKDSAKAIELYKEVGSKFPSHRLAKKGADRAAKLGAN